MSGERSFFSELKRRKVYRTGAAYLVASLTVCGVAELTTDAFELSGQMLRFVIVASLVGFPVALVLAWIFEIRGEAHDGDAVGRAVSARTAAVLISLSVLGGVATIVLLIRGGALGREPVPGVVPEGLQWRQVTFHGGVRAPAFSPDGGSLAFLDFQSDPNGGVVRRLLVQDLASGEEVELGRFDQTMRGPKWHPNGERIAFSLGGAGPEHVRGLYTISRMGRDVRLLVTLPMNRGAYAWHGGGDRLAALHQGRMYRLRVTETDVESDTVELPFGHHVEGVEWSPVDDLLAISASDDIRRSAMLYVMSVDGDVTDSIPDASGAQWLADGRWLLYRADEELRIVGVDENGVLEGMPSTVLAPPDGVGGWAYHAESRQVVVMRREFTSHLYRMALRSERPEPEQVTRGTAGHAVPRLSADGTLLAYMKWGGGSADIYFRPESGGAERRLRAGDADGDIGYVGRWSPDGTRFSFSARTDQGYAIMAVDIAGGAREQLGTGPTIGASDWGPMDWSPDGRRVVYMTEDEVNLQLVDLETGSERTLLDPASELLGRAIQPLFAPDGRRMAYTVNYGGSPPSLWLLDVAGGSPRKVADGALWAIRWLSADTLAVRRENQVLAVGMTDGGQRLLGLLPDQCLFPEITLDGSVAYCTMGRGVDDFFLGSAGSEGQ